MKTLEFLLALIRTSIRASISLRGAFILESILMIGNNLLFFGLWWIFFRQFDDIGGWQLDDMAASMAMLSGAYGVANICGGGVRTLGLMILNGDLDPFMTQPKNLLLHIIFSKSRSKGWGHILTAIILFCLGGFHSLPLILTLIVSGAVIFISMGIIMYSLTFWFGKVESVSKRFLDSLFVFALYPTNIYSGFMQIVMFTVIPAGLIGYLPVELLRNFSWDKLAILTISSLSFLGFAFWLFYKGLKRYESGNKFGMRL